MGLCSLPLCPVIISSLLPSLQLGGQFRNEKRKKKNEINLKKKGEGYKESSSILDVGVAIGRRSVFVLLMHLCWPQLLRWRLCPESPHTSVLSMCCLLSFFFFFFFFKSIQSQHIKTGSQAVGGSGWRAGWLPYLSPAHWLTQYAPILTLLASRLACPTT